MVATKKKLMAYILSFVMAFTVFGILGTAQVNAEGEAAFTITLSATMDENVTKDSVIEQTQIRKTFTMAELESMADVTSGDYMFTKNGQTANVYHVNKGVTLEKMIRAAVGEDADVSAYAGLRFWDAADLSQYYGKIANFKDHMVNPTYWYGDAMYDTAAGAINWGDAATEVEPVLALDYDYGTLDSNTAGTKASELQLTHDTQNTNRVFLGMLNTEETGGFWSQTNSSGIDLIRTITDISGAAVTVKNQTYTGEALTPEITVKFGSVVLRKDTDYTAEFANNTTVGTATVTITGQGNYFGTNSAEFTIAAAPMKNAAISSIKAHTYTGKAQTPKVTVKYNGITLKNGTDYNVAYKNNTDAGKATVTVTGKGNFTGTKTAQFTINPAAQKLIVSKATKSVKYSKKNAKYTSKVSVKGAKTTVKYAKAGGSAKLSINAKTGKIKVKKDTKKGKYTITVKVTAAESKNYKAATAKQKITVKVK